MSDQFPELVSEIRPIPQDFVADGELVILDDQSRPQWDRLHSRTRFVTCIAFGSERHATPQHLCVRSAMAERMHFPGTTAPRAESGAASHLASQSAHPLRTSPEQRLRSSWEMAVNLELEGIVAKDGRSTYQAGRSTGWQKIKTAMGVERERSGAANSGRLRLCNCSISATAPA